MDSRRDFKIILGSSSVARKKILADMGFEFTTMSADIDEKAIREEKPEDLVMVLAEAKADAIVEKIKNGVSQENDVKPTIVIAADTAESVPPKVRGKEDGEPTLLITCDQVVVYEGMIREKPSSKEEARLFMKGYSGGYCATVSSVLVTNFSTGLRKGGWDKVEMYARHALGAPLPESRRRKAPKGAPRRAPRKSQPPGPMADEVASAPSAVRLRRASGAPLITMMLTDSNHHAHVCQRRFTSMIYQKR